MKIHDKSPARIDSQAITFASEYSQSQSSKEELVEKARGDIGSVATHALYGEYVHFLRSRQNNERINQREELGANYEGFRSDIAQLRDIVDASGSTQDGEAFIAAGTQANVYGLHHEHSDYVVRVSKYADGDAVWADKYVAGTLGVRGVPHFEQIAAIDYESGVIVSERMPGHALNKLQMQDIAHISDEQLRTFARTLEIAHDHAIRLDAIPANFMYDQEAGFGLIDLESDIGKSDKERTSLPRTLEMAASVLGAIGEDVRDSNMDIADPAYYAQRAALLQARKDVLARFEYAIDDVAALTTEERQSVVEYINKEVYLLDQNIQYLSDPDRVAVDIEAVLARRREAGAVDTIAQEAQASTDWNAPSAPMSF